MPSEKELKEVGEHWSQALRNRDVTTLSRILADDFQMVDLSGKIIGKSAYLGFVQAQNRNIVSEAQLKVRIDGDTGVVVGRSSVTIKTKAGSQVSKKYVYTDIFKHFDQGWQCIASHSGRVD